VLCDDGVGQNLLLGGAVLALAGHRRLVLLLLEFATHCDGGVLRRGEVGGWCEVWSGGQNGAGTARLCIAALLPKI
jgi:hypothetical protein